jgi:ankyrin repeat protein
LYEHTAAFKVLIEFGADVNQANNDKVTPLYVAAEAGNEEVVKLLLALKADPNPAPYLNSNRPTEQDINGPPETPLSRARQEDHRNIVDLLVRAGAQK